MAKPDGRPSSPSRTEKPAAVGSFSSPCSSSAVKAKRARHLRTRKEQATVARQVKSRPEGFLADSGVGLTGECAVSWDVRKAYRAQALPEGRGSRLNFKAVCKAFHCLSSEESMEGYGLVGSDEPSRSRPAHGWIPCLIRQLLRLVDVSCRGGSGDCHMPDAILSHASKVKRNPKTTSFWNNQIQVSFIESKPKKNICQLLRVSDLWEFLEPSRYSDMGLIYTVGTDLGQFWLLMHAYFWYQRSSRLFFLPSKYWSLVSVIFAAKFFC